MTPNPISQGALVYARPVDYYRLTLLNACARFTRTTGIYSRQEDRRRPAEAHRECENPRRKHGDGYRQSQNLRRQNPRRRHDEGMLALLHSGVSVIEIGARVS